MDKGLNILRGQMLLQLVAFFALDYEEMVVMKAVGRCFVRTKPLAQTRQIARSQIPAAFVPRVQTRQFNAQNSSL